MPSSQVRVPAGTNGWLRILLGFLLVVAVLLCVMDTEVEAFVNIRGPLRQLWRSFSKARWSLRSVYERSKQDSDRGSGGQGPLDNCAVLLSVDELVLRYSLLELVMYLNNAERAISEVVLRSPQLWVRVEDNGQWNVSRLFRNRQIDGDTVDLTLKMEKGEVLFAGTNLGAGDISDLDGALRVNGSTLLLERAAFRVLDSEFVASGSLDAGDVDLVLKGSDLDLGRIGACFPQTQDVLVRGKAEMEIRAKGPLAEPVLDAMVAMERGRLEFPAHDHTAYSVDRLEGFFRYEDKLLEVTKLDIVQGDARFRPEASLTNR